jgi:integrase
VIKPTRDAAEPASDPPREAANRVHLNVQKLDALKPKKGAARTEYWDHGLRGFGVRVAASGRKTFTVRYRLHGRNVRHDIGVYRWERGTRAQGEGKAGGEISFSDAHAEAGRILSAVRDGRDPFLSSALLRKAQIDSFDGLCKAYLEDPNAGRKGKQLAEETRKGIRRAVEVELTPRWGTRDPNEIQPEEIEAWARGVATGEGRTKPVPVLANRLVDYMHMIYAWARRRKLLRYNPCEDVEKPTNEEPRFRQYSNDELRRLFEGLKTAPKQLAAMWLMFFYTGGRLREVLNTEWSWVDFEKAQLVLPPNRTKTKVPYLVPLVPQAVELLKLLAEVNGPSLTPYVFPGPKADRPLNGPHRATRMMFKRMGIEDSRHHDARKIVHTMMGELQIEPHIRDMVIQHSARVRGAARSSAAYDMHAYLAERRQAIEKFVAKLTEVVGYPLNDVMKPERLGNQGRGFARRSGHKETYAERVARLKAEGRDLASERREHRGRRKEKARLPETASLQTDPSRAAS